MRADDDEESAVRSVALQNAAKIESARQLAERNLLDANEKLRARERELSLIYENVGEGVFSLAVEPDGGFRFLTVNDAFLRATGLDQAQIIGKRVDEVFPEPLRTLALMRYREACDAKRTVRWERMIDHPLGQRMGEVSATPVLDDLGRCTNLIGTIRDVTERNLAAETSARLAAVVESSDDAIISKSLDGVIASWNRGAERIFGYTAAEVIGKSITILIPEERTFEEPDILARLRRGERIDHFETVRLRKDGARIDVSLTVSPVRAPDGRIVGVSKIARDITERRRADEALREETRALELLNETGTLLASELDLGRLVQSITDAATRLSGAKFGAFFYNVIDAKGESYFLYALSGAPREAFDKFGLPRNTPVFDPTFRGLGVIRSADITKDPRYGQMGPHHGMPPGHLAVRSYLAAPVISRSGEVIGGLFFGHPDTGVFNARIERIILGVAAQAAVAIDNARLYEASQRAAAERERLLEAERAARTEAERVSVMKDEFLATLSHELRTPLNAILGWAQLLRGQPRDRIDDGLEVIERNAKAQTQLIEDLLDMSRIASGKVRLDVQGVDLPGLLHAAVDAIRHSAEAKDIRLQVVVDPLAGPVRGDPNRLQQCFWNLLSNAIKFTPKGGKVQVALARVESHVEISVTDDGEGIAPDFLPFVFERFRQADSSSTRNHGGLGLGLSIVKNLVELHGGTVRAKSAGPGRGATFCIELPLLVVHAAPEERRRRHPSSPSEATTSGDFPSLDGVTVLAVDDEPDARELIRAVLGQCGARVLLASSAAEGLAMVSRERPDMILSDIGMPGEDGYALIRHVRALPANEGGRTPAAALTAFARAEDRTRALRAGFQTHVVKPVEPTELAAVVASLATRR
jgi:PAS domain S-box-containing protein